MRLEEALKTLPHIPKPDARIPHIKRCAVVMVNQTAITNAASEKPVLVSWGAKSCFAIFAYDRERKRLGVHHTSGWDYRVAEMIAAVRENDDSRPVEIFLVGRGNTHKIEDNLNNRDASLLVRYLSERVPNAILKHADILNKNGLVEDHAMDARTGDFFFLKHNRRALMRHEIALESAGIPMKSIGFDGTLPEHQRKDFPFMFQEEKRRKRNSEGYHR